MIESYITTMDTYKELLEKWGDDLNRGSLTYSQEFEYVQDWYKIGFKLKQKPYEATYSEYKKYNGQSFTIIDVVTTEESDLCALPLWKIVVEDGSILWAECDEIFDFEDEPEQENNINVKQVIDKPGEEVLVITKEEAKTKKYECVKNFLREFLNAFLSNKYNTINHNVVISEIYITDIISNKLPDIIIYNGELSSTGLFGLLDEYSKSGWEITYSSKEQNFIFS